MTYFRILTLVLTLMFVVGDARAELPSDFNYPRTVSTIREIIPPDGLLNGCSKNGAVRECWQCVSLGCTYRAKKVFDGWKASCSLTVFSDKDSKRCSISGEGIAVGQNMSSTTPQFRFQAIQEKGSDLHESRPVHVTIDNQRFTNPENGPYSELELQSADGVLLESRDLLDLIANANRITTESWDVNDEKTAKTDRGKGFSEARKFVLEFQKSTL